VTFTARFYGVCVACHDTIRPGQTIAVKSPVGYVHDDCAVPEDIGHLHGNVCPTCHLEMPLSGVCDTCS
jgi:hypothetical protein